MPPNKMCTSIFYSIFLEKVIMWNYETSTKSKNWNYINVASPNLENYTRPCDCL